MNKQFITLGAILITLSIILGALGAHALKKILTPEQLTSFETGVKYQLYAGMGMIIFQIVQQIFQLDLKTPTLLLFSGCLLFSFSIYLLNLRTALNLPEMVGKILGPVTPVGGLLQISAWIIFIVKWIKS
jgi:uncharacterized membrane protein YgdD (TMEM256/DUF423 family)